MHSSTYEQVHRPLRQCIYNYAYILQLLMPIGSYTVDLGLSFAQDSCYNVPAATFNFHTACFLPPL